MRLIEQFLALQAMYLAASAESCPPEGWDRCGAGKWPPTSDAPCCSSHGWLGVSKWHCDAKFNGINALEKCCKKNDDGSLNCADDNKEEAEPEDETCPPKGWDRCASHNSAWPPQANQYCCSSSGWLGTSPAHCKTSRGGINALKRCCKLSANGYSLDCKSTKKPDDKKPVEPEKPTCPPKGWDRCHQHSAAWPPRADQHCCSSAGWLGTSKWHCELNGGINALDQCCTLHSDGTLDCNSDGVSPKPHKSESSDSEDVPAPPTPEPSESEDVPAPPTPEPSESEDVPAPPTPSDPSESDEFAPDAECPPKGWDRCSKTWPPPEDGFCCSTSGWLGKDWGHCNNGGINAMDKCCGRNEFGHFKCKLPPGACPTPPDVCTGNAKIDAVLKKSNIGCNLGLTKFSPVYTWKGFCKAVRQFNLIGDRKLFLGDGSKKSCGQGLSNIAALLAQAMWESGGDAPWSACDENNYTGTKTAACTQRADGSLYASLNDRPWACTVDRQMTMTAVTAASWTPGPMKCAPGTATEGCCWWGRGAIQTTGPNNYGNLNKEVFAKIPTLSHIDLCTNPEAICQNAETKWLGAIFYWANDVQGYTDDRYKKNFFSSLHKFVDSGFNRSASVVAGADFASGTGGVVNNGWWSSTPHKNEKRLANFDMIMSYLKKGGMGSCNKL